MSDPPQLSQAFGFGEMADLLATSGVDTEEIERACAVNRLELLAMQYLMDPPGPRYDEAQVAERVGCPVEVSRIFWRALGFPQPDRDDPVFTDEDIEMMRGVLQVIDAGDIPPEISVEMTRVIGSSMARIAIAQVDVLDAELRRRDELIAQGAGAENIDAGSNTAEFLPLMPQIFSYVWRRHTAAGARARLSLALADTGQDEQVVGFADLVGYTALSQQLEGDELAEVVQRFEAIAYDTISQLGGRVVKLIGDGVLFSADDIGSGAQLAVELATRYRDDEELSDVRVGLAVGPVLRRDGDLYGPTVNLASRIVNVAYPGTVLVGERIKEALEHDERYELKKVRSHNLKDIGRTRLWALRLVDVEQTPPDPSDSAEENDAREPAPGTDDAQRAARTAREKLDKIRAAEERRASRAVLMQERRDRRQAKKATTSDGPSDGLEGEESHDEAPNFPDD